MRGRKGGKRLLLMSHSDVVPVEDETLWEHPPFSGTIDQGRVYGRGADDDKGDVVAHGMAMILLKRAGVQLGGELIYMVNADEESGGRWGAGWVADHLPDKVRATSASTRAAASPIHTPQRPDLPDLHRREGPPGGEDHQDGPLRARLAALGAPTTRCPTLAQVIDKIAAYEPEIDASHPFFREMLEALGIDQTPNAENIDRDRRRAGRDGHEALGDHLQGRLADDDHADDARGRRQEQQHPRPRAPDLRRSDAARPGRPLPAPGA